MSDLQVTPTGAAGGTPVSNTPVRRGPEAGNGLQQQSGQALQTGQSTAAYQSESLSITSSSSSLSFEQSSYSEQMAVLVMMLIEILFGQGQENEDESNAFTGMAAMMMLSSFSQSYEQISYYESQSSLSITASSTSAVQASSYAQSSGDATSATPLGNNLDVTG